MGLAAATGSNVFVAATENLPVRALPYLFTYMYIFIYLLQLGCYPVAVVILHVNKT